MEISDGILRNILSRLPPNPLMRFRCVSMHWNSLISDPYFVNLRSRPKILFSGPDLYSHLHTLDTKPHSMAKLPFPIKNRSKRRCIIAFGTFNGIVALVRRNDCAINKLVLYNPLTGATKILPDPPYLRCNHPRTGEVYGFVYGDDLKIIIAYPDCECRCRYSSVSYCQVFSFEGGSWTKSYSYLKNDGFKNTVGVFLNGFLHWISTYSNQLQIVALDVRDFLGVSRIDGPCQSDRSILYGLGTLQGCLCMIEPNCNGFDVWVMKEQGVSNSWSKEYSFVLALEYDYKRLHTLCILKDGRIVVMDGPYRIVFCDPSKGSYNVFINTEEMLINGNGIEYVESLASPSDFC